MRNIRLLIEYRGEGFSGWQWQPSLRTVQGELLKAIQQVTGEEVMVTGAGRTDAGVHALGQVGNFRTNSTIAPERFAHAIGYYLPDDLLIHTSEEVPTDFDARRDATFRRYRYLVSTERSVVYRALRWEYAYELDHDLLQEGARRIVGTHDFSPFCVTASLQPNNECRIYTARWFRIGRLFSFEIRGDRFLHGMVRSLVAALVNLASRTQDANPGNLTLESFTDIIEHPHGRRIVFTAPAQGLYLVSVGYPGDTP